MTVLSLLLIITCISDSLVVESAESGDAVEFQHPRDRNDCSHGDEDSKANINPQPEFDQNPIEDARRSSALLMMAQQNMPEELVIPTDLQQEILQYSDYNEIRSLFKLFTSSDDRSGALGYEHYEQIHHRYPARADKLKYLKRLGKRRPILEIGDSLNPTITFDAQNKFIEGISISKHYFDESPHAINWDAVASLKHLEVLQLNHMKITVSMEDIRKLPDSVKVLEIRGNSWTNTTGNVDLRLLPQGVKVFAADHCKGMNGSLKMHAPSSNLEHLSVGNTDLCLHVEWNTEVPPSLQSLVRPRNWHIGSIQFLKAKGIRVYQ